MNFLIVALGGAIGAVARYQVGLYIKEHFDTDSSNFLTFGIPAFSMPLATLIVNVLGSFLFGIAFYLIVEKSPFYQSFSESMFGSISVSSSMSETLRLFILVGLLGAFTTFSTFTYELLVMIQKDQLMFAMLSVMANVLLSFSALAIAYYGSKQLFS